jgi:hypothetical protein
MKKVLIIMLSIIFMGTIAIGGGFLFIGFWLETIINRLDKKANVGNGNSA